MKASSAWERRLRAVRVEIEHSGLPRWQELKFPYPGSVTSAILTTFKCKWINSRKHKPKPTLNVTLFCPPSSTRHSEAKLCGYEQYVIIDGIGCVIFGCFAKGNVEYTMDRLLLQRFAAEDRAKVDALAARRDMSLLASGKIADK